MTVHVLPFWIVPTILSIAGFVGAVLVSRRPRRLFVAGYLSVAVGALCVLLHYAVPAWMYSSGWTADLTFGLFVFGGFLVVAGGILLFATWIWAIHRGTKNGRSDGSLTARSNKRFYVLGVAVLVTLLLGGYTYHAENAYYPHYRASAETYSTDWSTVQVPQGTFVTTSASGTMSESEYKRRCRNVDFKDFKGDLNAHKGEDVHFKGTFLGTTPASDSALASVSGVTPGLLGSTSLNIGDVGNDEWGKVEFIWPEPVPDFRFGQDVIEVWGECQGACVSGEWGDGSPVISPVVRARYVTVHSLRSTPMSSLSEPRSRRFVGL